MLFGSNASACNDKASWIAGSLLASKTCPGLTFNDQAAKLASKGISKKELLEASASQAKTPSIIGSQVFCETAMKGAKDGNPLLKLEL
jgi:hypothetical protein